MKDRSEFKMNGRQFRSFGCPQQLAARHHPDTPEKRLMIAILADAVNCFRRYGSARGRGKRRIVHEAENWLMSADTSWPFSFENICDVLAIDPQHLRSSLQREFRTTPAHAA